MTARSCDNWSALTPVPRASNAITRVIWRGRDDPTRLAPGGRHRYTVDPIEEVSHRIGRELGEGVHLPLADQHWEISLNTRHVGIQLMRTVAIEASETALQGALER